MIDNKKIFILTLCLSIIFSSFSQSKRIQNWYFGTGNKLDFSTSPPTVKEEGANTFSYANCTMSDTAGNVLFYTNGKNVYNKKHEIMPNGTGLKGEFGRVIIVPFPRNPNKYYIFTVDGNKPNYELPLNQRFLNYFLNDTVFAYSVVDMLLDHGNGAVVEKNIELLKPARDMLAVVKHENNKDFWVTVNKAGTNQFYTYLVNECGIQAPVVSEVGRITPLSGIYSSIDLKFSPNGKYLLNNPFDKNFFIHKFNKLTGVISEYQFLDSVRTENSEYLNFCLNFNISPNSKTLYYNDNGGGVLQFDLESNNIIASQKKKNIRGGLRYDWFNIQIGPDGNLYTTSWFRTSYEKGDSNFVAQLSKEDSVFSSQSIKELFPTKLNVIKVLQGEYLIGDYLYLDSIYIAGSNLPRFVDSYLDTAYSEYIFQTPQITKNKRFCYKDTVALSLEYIKDFKTASWSVDHGKTWSDPDSVTKVYKHYFSHSGKYAVKVALKNICFEDTLDDELILLDSLPVSGLGDSVQCFKEKGILHAGSGFMKYLWQNGDTSESLPITQSGKYKVTASNMCGSITDSTQVQFIKKTLEINTPRTCVINESEFEVKNIQYPILGYHWNLGNGDTFKVSKNLEGVFKYQYPQAGFYKPQLMVDYHCFSDTATTEAIVDDIPILNLGDSILTCKDEEITLDAGAGFTSYLWSDGSTSQTFTTQPFKGSETLERLVKVTVTNACGSQTDSVSIKKVQLWSPNIITPNGDDKNETLEIKSPLSQTIRLQIINRWGQEVYQSSDYKNDWDAKDLSDGIYYFNANYEGCPVLKGWVQVSR